MLNKAREILGLYPSLSSLDKVKILARMAFCVKPIMAVLERYLPERGRILDLGCGYGIISHLVAEDHPVRDVVGVDVSAHRIKVAERGSGNLRFVQGDIVSFSGNYGALFDRSTSKIPLAPFSRGNYNALSFAKGGINGVSSLGNGIFSQCDAIIIIDTLYLLSYQDQERVIRRCYENLNDRGVLIVKDNYKARHWRYFYAYAEEKVKTGIGVYGRESKGRELCYWKVEDFLGLLRDAGFEAEAMLLRWFLPYPGVFYVGRKGT